MTHDGIQTTTFSEKEPVPQVCTKILQWNSPLQYADGTRQLTPATPSPQWQNAYGDDFASPSSQDWSYDEEGYTFASPPLIPSSSNTLAPPAPVPQTLDEQKKYKPYPAVTGRTGPNKNLCTGKCRPGTCDSQGFCIDLGCGSVIHGGSQCKGKEGEHEKHTTTTKKKEKKPSITVPANFPSDVTITPAGDEPYPEDITR